MIGMAATSALSRLSRRRGPRAVAMAFGIGLAAASVGWAATLKLDPASYQVLETQLGVTVTLVLDASDCDGEPEVPEGTVTVRSGPSTPVSAVAGQDFDARTYTIPIGGVGQTQITRVLEGLLLDDSQPEGPETFRLTLEDAPSEIGCSGGGPVPLTLDPAGAIVTIDDPEDVPPQQVQFASASFAVDELDGVAIAVTRSGGTGGSVAVDFTLTAGTAEAGDFSPVSGTVTFPPGSASQTFEVEALSDADFDDETVTLELTNPRVVSGSLSVVLGSPAEATLAIDDTTVSPVPSSLRFAVAEIRQPEENASLSVSIQREGDLSAAARVDVAVGGTATLDQDFSLASSRTLSFAAGQSQANFVLRTFADNQPEGDETIVLELREPVGATLGSPSVLTISLLEPGGLQPEGTNPTSAQTGEIVELRVRVRNADGTPIQGETIVWKFEEDGTGGATFVDGSDRSQTDAQGIATKRVRLGPEAGTFRISASRLNRSGQQVFTVNVSEPLEDVASGPGAESVGEAIDQLCADPVQSRTNSLCTYFFESLTPPEQAEALDELDGDELGSAGTLALGGIGDQMKNLGSRLAALRGGGSRQSMRQLALQIQGKPVNPGEIAAVIAARDSGAALRAAVDRELARLDDADQEDVAAAEPEGPGVRRWGLFVSGQMSFGDQEDRSAEGGEAGFDFDTRGLTAGVDFTLNNKVFLGLAAGFLNTDTELTGDGGSSDAQGESLSFFGVYQPGASLYFQGTLTYGRNDYDLTRNLDMPGIGVKSARASTGGSQLAAGFDVGAGRQVRAHSLNGSVRVSYVDAQLDGYRERGADPFNVEVAAQDITSLQSELGFDWTYNSQRNWGNLRPMLRLSYLHEYDDDTRLIRGRFLVDPDLDNFFSIPTNAPDRDFFNAGFTLQAMTLHGTVFLSYNQELGRTDLKTGMVTFGLRQDF